MIACKCIAKLRDNKGKIYGYTLQDINGQKQNVQPDNLKAAIRNNNVHVINLKLTSDNRLIDCAEKQLQSPSLGDAPRLEKDWYNELMNHLDKCINTLRSILGQGETWASTDEVKHRDEYVLESNIYDCWDDEDCWSVNFGITYDKAIKEIWFSWCGDLPDYIPSIDMSAKLQSPLASAKNFEIIDNLMRTFAKEVQQWIKEEESGRHHKLITYEERDKIFKKLETAVKSGKYKPLDGKLTDDDVRYIVNSKRRK